MYSVVLILLAVAALPMVLASTRFAPKPMAVLAVLGCVLPLLLPASFPLLRAATATLAGLFLVKTLQLLAKHEHPRGYLDSVLFLAIPAVVRWEQPRRPNLVRARRSLFTGLAQLALAFALMQLGLLVAVRNPLQLVNTLVIIYLCLAGSFNLLVVPLALRGLDFDDPFHNPIAARTPAEFWGKRWNTWVNHMLYRYVFLHAGGRDRPARAVFAAFTVSGLLHELIVFAGTGAFSGWMGGFFLVQSVLVLATSHPRMRGLAQRLPRLSWALTLALMLFTGVLFVRGAAGIDPTDAWRRCCLS